MATSHADLLSYQESRWLLIAPFPASCIAEYVGVRTLNCSLCVAGLTSYDDSLLMALSASAQRQFAPVWSWIPDLFLLLCETPNLRYSFARVVSVSILQHRALPRPFPQVCLAFA